MDRIQSIQSPYILLAIIIGTLFVLHCIYVYATPFERFVTIKEKYNYASGQGKSLSVMNSVSDDSNRVYKITNCLPKLHFTSAEVLLSIVVGQKYKINGYGWRVPILGMYPNITSAI